MSVFVTYMEMFRVYMQQCEVKVKSWTHQVRRPRHHMTTYHHPRNLSKCLEHSIQM